MARAMDDKPIYEFETPSTIIEPSKSEIEYYGAYATSNKPEQGFEIESRDASAHVDYMQFLAALCREDAVTIFCYHLTVCLRGVRLKHLGDSLRRHCLVRMHERHRDTTFKPLGEKEAFIQEIKFDEPRVETLHEALAMR